jgi:hypothetical protein
MSQAIRYFNSWDRYNMLSNISGGNSEIIVSTVSATQWTSAGLDSGATAENVSLTVQFTQDTVVLTDTGATVTNNREDAESYTVGTEITPPSDGLDVVTETSTGATVTNVDVASRPEIDEWVQPRGPIELRQYAAGAFL